MEPEGWKINREGHDLFVKKRDHVKRKKEVSKLLFLLLFNPFNS
jgi:hypothetical protein